MAQVQAKFFTAQTEYAVPTASMRIPVDLQRQSLSELINHLLSRNLEEKLNFDFLVDGVLLRTTIDKYLNERCLSTENILNIEYLVSFPDPKPALSYNADDWIADAKIYYKSYISCGFDGTIAVWDVETGKNMGKFQHSKATLRSIEIFERNSTLYTVTGGLDRNLALTEFVDPQNARVLCEFIGHSGSILEVSKIPDRDMFVTASWDTNVHVYHLPSDLEPLKQAELKIGTKRKREESGMYGDDIVQSSILRGHTEAVTCISAGTSTIFSGGYDRTVRLWDLTAESNTLCYASDTPVMSICSQFETGLCASGHVDQIIRIFDYRTKAPETLIRSKHTGPVSGICWSPNNSFHFSTCSYDGSVKVFDIRSTDEALHVLCDPSSKRFFVQWVDDTVFSGGENCKIDSWKT